MKAHTTTSNVNNTSVSSRTKQQAYNLEVLPHLEALNSYALRLTGDRDEANDLTQETCMKAYRFFDRFEEGTNCKAWLFRIMKNSFINRYRQAQKRPESVDFDGIEEFYHSIRPSWQEGNDMQHEVFSQLLSDEVTSAFEMLPPDFKTVVILSDLEDFTYEEIAEFVDCPVGTVRSRLHRGRRLLRDYLSRYARTQGVAVAT